QGDLFRVLALAAVAVAEARVADPPLPRAADASEDTLAAFGIVLGEPAVEQLVDRLRQAKEDPARTLGPRARRGFEDARDLGVVQPRHDGTDHDADRHPGARERRHRVEPAVGTCRARLHAPR